MTRIHQCVWRRKTSNYGRQCSNPLRADGTQYIPCPYDGRQVTGACVFWDDGAHPVAEEKEIILEVVKDEYDAHDD